MTKRFAVSAALAGLLLVTGCATNAGNNTGDGGNATGANNTAGGGAYAGDAPHNDAGAGDHISGRAGDHVADPTDPQGVGQGNGSAQNSTGNDHAHR